MGVAADGDVPVIHGEVVEDFVNDIGHGVVACAGVAGGDHAEAVHEGHELGDVCLGFFIPDGGGVATGLVACIDDRGNDGGGHGFELLHGHEAGGVLRSDDVYLYADIGAGVEDGAGCGADGVAVENFLNGGEALAFFVISLEGEKTRGVSMPSVLAAKVWSFFPKTMA